MKSRETKRNASRLVNEWICVTGQYEKTLSRISQELYKAYRKGQLSDQDAIDHCKVLDGIFSQAKSVRTELKMDLATVVEKKSADSNKQVRGAKKKVGGFVSRQILGYWDSLNIPKYKEAASGTIQELSQRALGRADSGNPLLDSKDHLKLCRLGLALEKECQAAWERLLSFKKEHANSKSYSLSTLTVQVLIGMGKFAKKSKHGQKVARLLNYNETVEKAKLVARFAGRPEEGILRVQMGFAPA